MTKIDIIKINGRHYDARSGEVVDKTLLRADHTSSSAEPRQTDHHQKAVHGLARHRTPHKRQRARTLLRTAVKKPSLKNTDPKIDSVSLALGSNHIDRKTPSAIRVARDAHRSQVAQQANKSPLVHKFDSTVKNEKNSDVEYIEVKRVPISRPVQRSVFTQAAPARKAPNPFDTAVERANSHNQPPVQLPRNSFTQLGFRIMLITGLVLFVSAGVLHFEGPGLDINLASFSSNVSASLPHWIPTGYVLKLPVQYDSSRVILTYNYGDSTMQISEQESSWNNDQLLDNFVATYGKPYQTFYQNGPTVFIFNDGTATWVKGQIWYQLSTTGAIYNNNIQKIALNS